MLPEHDSAESDTLIGAALDKFEILQKIGEGSIGTIYRGKSQETGEEVAIKFLTREITTKPQILARFKREIQTAIKMRHPHIVRGYNAGVWEGCIYYYVMEFVDGPTLQDLLSRQRLDEKRIVLIAYQIASALQYIHEFGMVHRDIKPENIMINAEGNAKLADLGLAKEINDVSGLTMVGTIIGTPLYMSPEQAKGAAVIDIRADVYSLGASLYHAITGEPPFKGRTAPEVIAKQIEANPTPVRDLAPSVSAGLGYVIRKMMEKDPSARYQSPRDLMTDLQLLHEGRGEDADPDLPWARETGRDLAEFQFAYPLGEEDYEYGLTAVANKLVESESMKAMLDFQEEMARHGVPLRLAHIAVERGYLRPDMNRKIIDAQARQREMEQGTGLGKLAVKKKMATEDQIRAALKKQKEYREQGKFRLLGELLKHEKVLDDEGLQRLLALQKQIKFGKEDREFLDVAVRQKLVSRPVAEKVAIIQKNELAMNRYRRIGEILIDRRYLSPAARDALLRALRRKSLTGEPLETLIEEKKASAEVRQPDSAPDDALLDKYKGFVKKQLKKGKALYAKRRFAEAIDAWRAILEVVADSPEAAKKIRDTENIIDNMKAHHLQAKRHFQAATREWEGLLKIDPAYPDAISDLETAFGRLDEMLQAVGRKPEKAASGRAPAAEPEKAPGKAPADLDMTRLATPPSEEAEKENKIKKLLRQARRFDKAGKRTEAADKYIEILGIHPEHEDALDALKSDYRRRRNAVLIGLLSLVLLVGVGAAAGWFLVGEESQAWLAVGVLGKLLALLS